jgi:hypothetical protein
VFWRLEGLKGGREGEIWSLLGRGVRTVGVRCQYWIIRKSARKR